MSIDFKLANVLGTVFSSGTPVFTPDGRAVLSPVGNRVSYFDLVENSSFTLAYEHRKPVSQICVNHNGSLLLSVDTDGRGILVNLKLRQVLHHMNFKESVGALEFSPCGKIIAVAAGSALQLWHTPTKLDERQFAPFVRHRVYAGHYAALTSVSFSKDSRFILTSSQDMSARVFSVDKEDSFAATQLNGHKSAVLGAYFSADQETVFTVSKDGAIFQWQYSDEEEKWIITRKEFISSHGEVTCCSFCPKNSLLVTGFSGGKFGLFELPHATTIQTLSVSQSSVDHVQLNETGEWLLMASAELGQLMVWEWQSESFILKQQSQYDSLRCLIYSADGTRAITGSADGVIKVWDTRSGFALVTFTQHTAAVTALKLSSRNVLFSSSLDGSVRAWDLKRFRNFRTFVAPERVQFSSLGVDPSGELVCAGSLDNFDIHVWNVQTSALVDRLSGHEGPVQSLDFSPDGSLLASGSWDHTAKLWSFFGRTATTEQALLQTEVLNLCFRPDGKHLAISTRDGLISVYDVKTMAQVAEIDAKNDLRQGRFETDMFTSKNSSRGNHASSISYSVDGTMILAGGNSKYVCLYDVKNAVLLKRFTISKNMALDGTLNQLNSKNIVDGLSVGLIDHDEIDDSIASGIIDEKTRRKWKQNTLPGTKSRPMISASAVSFSPIGRSFSVASTEGLLVYSLDEKISFDPFDLDMETTLENCLEASRKGDHLQALIMAFRLGLQQTVIHVVQQTPVSSVPVIVGQLPLVYLKRMLMFLSKESTHLEFNLLWLRSCLEYHGRYIGDHRHEFEAALRSVQQFILTSKSLTDVAENNRFSMKVLRTNLVRE